MYYAVISCPGSDEYPYDHVSTHLRMLGSDEFVERTPTWEEMIYIKHLFFDEEEAAFQIAPPASTYINIHPYVLHWWRPIKEVWSMPPVEMV